MAFGRNREENRNQGPEIRVKRVKRIVSYVEKKIDRAEWRLDRIKSKLLHLQGLNSAEKRLFLSATPKATSNIQQARSLLEEIRSEIRRIRI